MLNAHKDISELSDSLVNEVDNFSVLKECMAFVIRGMVETFGAIYFIPRLSAGCRDRRLRVKETRKN